MKILITGIKGVVGTQLSKQLTKRGHTVYGIDLFHCADENYTRCDVSEYRQLEKVFKQSFDFVYHAAAEFGRWNGEDYYEQLWRTNAIGTKNIIRLQEKYGFKLIHFSSSEVYGDFEDTMSEDVMNEFPIRQMNDYAMTKWVNETQIRNSITQYGTKSVIVRLFNTYGAGETYHPYRSVNARFCYSALHGLPITVYKNYYRTSTYLDDTCRTLANIVDNFKSGEIYNIGGNEYHDIETLAELIWEYTGANKKLITYKDAEVLTTRIKKVDVSKAIKDLGHKNTISLEKGVKKTIQWMKSELQ